MTRPAFQPGDRVMTPLGAGTVDIVGRLLSFGELLGCHYRAKLDIPVDGSEILAFEERALSPLRPPQQEPRP